VAAVARQDAEGIADVLRQHKFAARIAPAPADPALFRVLVGPAKDAADLRNTQDALRKIGYTKCFVQHY
jgi:cell division septation protein DedD